ncbi:Helix-turn-helix protein [Candidatus Regiella insecticola 5.15]|uniref:Helix-turn-helix protein n=1 Tax=Candidatus Regiella insecticola 5.15 TaxID=1005043 RepID=G2H209_9ENTR|nr:helix-turn-helix transcriptional regulator [Candidatus Regiella insecticola]EGY27972.1 Helix-turn-helix protein [Candidatus Regiella insecticola 5.15]
MGLKKLQAAVMNDPVAKMEYNKLKHQDTLLQMLQVMRTEAGLTQEVIAQRMGTRPSHVSRLEKGGGLILV